MFIMSSIDVGVTIFFNEDKFGEAEFEGDWKCNWFILGILYTIELWNWTNNYI